MKKLFTIALVLMLSLMVIGNVFAAPVVHWMNFGPTGWGGWSCPAGQVVVGGGYKPGNATVLISEAAKPGSASGLYPVYPHYTYTPPEEGWVVQNDNDNERIGVYVNCKVPYKLCDETDRALDEVECSEWSEFVWDAARNLFVSTRTCTVYNVWVDSRDSGHECRRAAKKPTIEEQTRRPNEVIVNAGLRCGATDSEGAIWQLIGGVTVNPAGGATLTFDGIDYTSSQGFHTNLGSHEWSAVASTGYNILGDDHGTITITESDCNEPGAPPVHIATGPSGQPINLSLVVLMGLIGISALSAGAFAVRRRHP